MNAPLIITLKLDETSATYFNTLREQHFPKNLNFLRAHLTLFHHLPNTAAVVETIRTTTKDVMRFQMQVAGLMKLGRGVAFKIESVDLFNLREDLHQSFKDDLTPQDRQSFRPHITIQNKVEPKIANALYHSLMQNFQPLRVDALGLTISEYHGGPWVELASFDFR